MKQYLIEYLDPRTRYAMTIKMFGSNKTEVRDLFWEQYPLFEIERITWIPNIK